MVWSRATPFGRLSEVGQHVRTDSLLAESSQSKPTCEAVHACPSQMSSLLCSYLLPPRQLRSHNMRRGPENTRPGTCPSEYCDRRPSTPRARVRVSPRSWQPLTEFSRASGFARSHISRISATRRSTLFPPPKPSSRSSCPPSPSTVRASAPAARCVHRPNARIVAASVTRCTYLPGRDSYIDSGRMWRSERTSLTQ